MVWLGIGCRYCSSWGYKYSGQGECCVWFGGALLLSRRWNGRAQLVHFQPGCFCTRDRQASSRRFSRGWNIFWSMLESSPTQATIFLQLTRLLACSISCIYCRANSSFKQTIQLSMEPMLMFTLWRFCRLKDKMDLPVHLACGFLFVERRTSESSGFNCIRILHSKCA